VPVPPLIRDGELFNRLHSYLSIAEIQALEKRISTVIAAPYFPFLPPGRAPLPYPPLYAGPAVAYASL